MKITITASDGTEFGTKEECINYESTLLANEEREQAERNRLLAAKTELRKEIENTISELNDKVSDYRKLPTCSIRYGLDNYSQLCVEFDSPGRAFVTANGNPLMDFLMRM